MATKEQLRKLRQKYHLGEYKRKGKVYKHHKSRYHMAKKRRSHKRYGSKGGMKGVWSSLLGVGVYILYENYFEKMIPLQEPMLSVAELGVGYWLSKKGGMMGDIGKAAVYINVYQLGKYFIGSTLGSASVGGNVTSMFQYN